MWNYSSFKKREKLKKKRLMAFVFWLKAIKAIIYLDFTHAHGLVMTKNKEKETENNVYPIL